MPGNKLSGQDPSFSLGCIFCDKLPANFLPRKAGRIEARSSRIKSSLGDSGALGNCGGRNIYVLHMHTARARQEEHLSQGTAQGKWRGKIGPEISQKLCGMGCEQAIPAAVAAGREPGEGRAFRTTGHCISSVRFHTDASIYISWPRIQNKCSV